MEKNKQQFQRKMQTRHLVMLSLGGVIGTGLFLSSGYTIQQAGPIGTILAYLIGALVVYLVMLCLGSWLRICQKQEPSTAMPLNTLTQLLVIQLPGCTG